MSERSEQLIRHGVEVAQRDFDPDRHLIGQQSARDPNVRTYRQSASLPYARWLCRQGDPESLSEAAAIVAAVLESQELSPDHPNVGNWLWLADDPEIADLNAVQFVLRGLLPILVRYDSLLPAELVELCRERVRLALVEEERLDVAPTYTNIHLMSLLALIVGGEWLQDDHFFELGRARWQRWVEFTLRSGAPHEYNSPAYSGVDMATLGNMQSLVRDPSIKLQTRLMYERFWLHFALHMHRPTRQNAGPHCRCYWPSMTTGRGAVHEALWLMTGWPWLLEPGPYGGDSEMPANLELALTEQWMPDYVRAWLERQGDAMPYEVRETANVGEGFDLTTYFTPEYALGTASKTYGIGTDCFYIEHQSNYLMLHYARPDQPGGWGMMYTRYVVNEQHWGTLGAAPDRPKTANFYDQGHFAGVQLHNKAIGLYALKPQHEEVHSLKTVVAFQSGDDLQRVWINDVPVDLSDALPKLESGDWLIVEDGSVYVGVYPLCHSKLGHDAPILLERGPLDELWLSIYNYRGATKRFWDYASLKGAFWRGNVRAGMIVEVAARHEHDSAAEFLAHLRRAAISDGVDENSIRTVTYANDGENLTLRYDLWNTELHARMLNGRSYVPPNLTSPLAVQGDTGLLQAGSATLSTAPQQLFLIAQELDASTRSWIAINPTDQATPLRLECPAGTVTASAWGMGRIEWRAPQVGEQVIVVEGLRSPTDLAVPKGVRVDMKISEGQP